MVAIADLIFGKLIGWYIDHYKLPGDYQKFQYMIKNTNEDILLLGSSVCMNSIIPELVEKEFHMSCFNGGANAQSLEYVDTMIDIVLNHHTPKIIILCLRPYDLFLKTNERYNMFRIYYKHGFPKIDRYLESGSLTEYLAMQSSFYRLNTYGWRLLLYHFKSYNELNNGGFVGKPKLAINPPLVIQPDVSSQEELPKPNIEKLEILRQIFIQCKKHNVTLFVTIPPAYYEIGNVQKYQCHLFKEYCDENAVPFFDDFYNPYFIKHPEFFYDNNHLNVDGAKNYTKQLLEKLQTYVKKN